MVRSESSTLCRTGIAGLDEILIGGLARHRLYLIQGDPGVGKTTLAMQFLMEGVRAGEKCLHITLSETKEELLASARSHGWTMQGIEILDMVTEERNLLVESQNTLFHPSEVELNETASRLRDKLERFKPDRVVLDSLSEFRLLAQEPLRFRRQMLAFKQFFAERKTTVLMLDDLSTSDGETNLQIQSIAHGVVYLRRMETRYGTERRQISVLKMRGQKFQDGSHDYQIATGGLHVYPRLIASDKPRDFRPEVLASNVKGLEEC